MTQNLEVIKNEKVSKMYAFKNEHISKVKNHI